MLTIALSHPVTNTVFLRAPADDVVFSTTRDGDERLRATIRNATIASRRTVFDTSPFAVVTVRAFGRTVWSGRVVDAKLVHDNGTPRVAITATGWKSALNDSKYTAVWSTTDPHRVRLVYPNEILQAVADMRVKVDVTDRITLHLTENYVFFANDRVCLAFIAPHRSSDAYNYIQFSCSPPPTDFVIELIAVTDAPLGSLWTMAFTSSGYSPNTLHQVTLATSYQAIVLAIKATVSTVIPSSGATVTISQLRCARKTPPVTARDILQAKYPSTVQLTQLSFSDLENASFEDEPFSHVIDTITKVDDIEYSVIAPNTIALRKRSSIDGRQRWSIVADTVELSRDSTTIANATYARYRSRDPEYRFRTTMATAQIAREVYANGVERDDYIDVDTSDVSVANAARYALLSTRNAGTLRVRATTRTVFTSTMAPAMVWDVRAGDVVTILNADSGSAPTTFIVDRTDVDTSTMTLTVSAQIDEDDAP